MEGITKREEYKKKKKNKKKKRAPKDVKNKIKIREGQLSIYVYARLTLKEKV